MKVTVTGATGTLGREVVAELRERGDEVTVLSRDADRAREKLGTGVNALTWADPKTQAPPADALAGQDAVVHLLGEPIAQSDDAVVAQGHRLLACGARNVLIKGGHGVGPDSVDHLVMPHCVVALRAPRIATANTHGTGCSLSAGIAAFLARGA